LAEFPQACFIFDEVHAYDPRIVGLTLATAKLVNKWGGRALFLSATLPNFLVRLIREALGDIPAIAPDPAKERDREVLNRKRHTVEIRKGNLGDHLQTVMKAVDAADSTLVVCNHVPTAQSVFGLLRSKFGEACLLLHSRFNQEDRNDIEGKVVRRPPPKLLVATQVVEVSLDIDFDQAFLEPAPIDALIQRMGRVNRAGERKGGPAPVVLLTEEVNRRHLYCSCPADFHKPDCRVRRSLEELGRIPNPISESDLVDGANRVYSEGYTGDDERTFEEGLTHPDIAHFESRLLAGAHQDWVEEVIERTDGNVELLPQCLEREFNARQREGLWIEANSLLVPVRARSLSWLRPRLDMSSDPWLVNAPYCNRLGLQL
jgi:CRISPR-associated endonuclease/helicase Cas3